MLIAKDSAVTIHFQLLNTQGKVLEKSQQPLAFFVAIRPFAMPMHCRSRQSAQL